MKNSHLGILIFNIIYLSIFGIFYIKNQNYEFIWYIFVIVIIGSIIAINLKKSHLDNLVLWLLSILGLAHMVAGGILVNGSTIYSIRIINLFDGGGQFFILKMDQVIHFYGFFVAALLVYQLLKATGSIGYNFPKLIIFLSWIGSMGLGALNEVVEFSAFLAIEHTGVGDLYNTGLDLIFNMLGALVGAFLAHKLYKK